MLLGREPFYPVFRSFFEQVTSQGVVLDLGTPASLHKELSDLRGLLRCARYVTMDFPPAGGPLASDVAGDIEHLPFGEESADGIICKEVLEHVQDPFRAIDEIHRVLKPGGLLLLTVPFLEPYHAKPGGYEDYWRFTSEGIRRLLARFGSVEVKMYGGILYMLAVAYLPRWLRRLLVAGPLRAPFWFLDGRWRRSSTIMHMALARK